MKEKNHHVSLAVIEPSTRLEVTPIRTDRLLNVVTRLSFFQQMPAKAQRQVVAKMTMRNFMPKFIVARESLMAESLLIVLSGKLAVFSNSRSSVVTGNSLTRKSDWDLPVEIIQGLGSLVGTAETGECYGTRAFFDQTPRASSLVVIEESEIAVISYSDYTAVLKEALNVDVTIRLPVNDVSAALDKQSARYWTREEREAVMRTLSVDKRLHNISESVKVSIAELLRLERVDAGAVIQNEHEPNTCNTFFIVVSGTLSAHSISSSVTNTHDSQVFIDGEDNLKSQNNANNISALYGSCTDVYCAGDFCGVSSENDFSQLIVQSNIQSIIARQSCILLRASITDVNAKISSLSDSIMHYDEIVRIASHKHRLKADNNFLLKQLQHLSFFQQLQEHICLELVASSRILHFNTHDILTKQDACADLMFIVIRGSISIHKHHLYDQNVNINTTFARQFHQLRQSRAICKATLHDQSIGKHSNHQTYGIHQDASSPPVNSTANTTQNTIAIDKVLESVGTTICALSAGECVGVEAMYVESEGDDESTYHQTALARTAVEVLVLHREDALRIFYAPGLISSSHIAAMTVRGKKGKKIMKVLAAKSIERSDSDLAMLGSQLSFIKFITDLAPPLRRHVLRFMRLEHYAAHTCVFEQGCSGDTFYIVLRGSVSVHVHKHQSKQDPVEQAKSKHERTHSIASENASTSRRGSVTIIEPSVQNYCFRLSSAEQRIHKLMNFNRGFIDNIAGGHNAANNQIDRTQRHCSTTLSLSTLRAHIDIQNANTESIFGPFVMTIFAGSGFGELALMHHKPRGASIITRGKTVLIALSRKNFMRTQRRLSTFGTDFFDSMLQKSHPFNTLRRHDRIRIARVANYRKYKADEIIAAQGEIADEIYIVISGYAKIAQDILATSPALSSDMKRCDVHNAADISEINGSKESVRIDLAVLGPHECIGEADCLAKRLRRYSIISANPVELILLRRSHLLAHMPKSTLMELEQLAKQRDNLRSQRVCQILNRVPSLEQQSIRIRESNASRLKVQRAKLAKMRTNEPIRQPWFSSVGRQTQTSVNVLERTFEERKLNGQHESNEICMLSSADRAHRMLQRLYRKQTNEVSREGQSNLQMRIAKNLSAMLRSPLRSGRPLNTSSSVNFVSIDELKTPRKQKKYNCILPPLKHSGSAPALQTTHTQRILPQRGQNIVRLHSSNANL